MFFAWWDVSGVVCAIAYSHRDHPRGTSGATTTPLTSPREDIVEANRTVTWLHFGVQPASPHDVPSGLPVAPGAGLLLLRIET